ncbi:MAG: glycosyltransferase family 1 protein [Alphaproteobacteria bacterium]|nr:glycosyltransferase family 1 protein [Alphaproteobacteria bacterium]
MHRILYIRHRRANDLSDAFRLNQDEWVKALALQAEVTIFDADFDLEPACDRVQPDFIIYESPLFNAVPLNIQNPRAQPQIPRFGLLTQDPICGTRVAFLRMLDALGAFWILSHLPEATIRQSPEFAPRLISIPMFFDAAIFRDYGLDKDIPVSVFGGLIAPEIYHWRAATARAASDKFPTFIYASSGYTKPAPRHKFAVAGEAYARMLNRSHFSLADPTRLDYPVRKILEIPACGAILVAPDAPCLRPYGFRDMENCLLGEGDVLMDKIAAVADDPVLYDTIRRAGHDHVHARFRRENWRGILDFYDCFRNLRPGETLRQNGVLGTHRAAPVAAASYAAIDAHLPASEISAFLGRWLEALSAPDGLRRDADFLKIPDWLLHMEEPFVLNGIAVLLKGDAAQARELLVLPQRMRAEQTGFTDYDPEEIAWLMIVAALTGDSALSALTRRESEKIRHVSLRRVAWLGQVLAAGGNTANPPPDVLCAAPDDRVSIHRTGQMNFAGWMALIRRVLAANGQDGLLK